LKNKIHRPFFIFTNVKFLTLIFILFSSLSLSAATEIPPELDRYISEALTKAKLPGAAIAIVTNEGVIAKGYGLRKLGRNERIDENTLFDSASLMKSFTAAAIAVLVDEGKMKLDDPVRKHLPWFEFSDPYLTAHATIRDLLSHRVGVEPAHGLFRFTGFNTREVLERVRSLELETPFRTASTYNNVLYTAAGEAGAAACDCSFEKLVTTRILKPLGLHRSKIGGNPLEDANGAHPHVQIEGTDQPVRWRAMDSNTDPAGGLLSTAKELGQWLLFHTGDGTWQGKRVISEEMLIEMHSPQIIISSPPRWRESRKVEFFGGYGLGWNVMDYRGHPMIWHSGGGDGMRTYMALLPKQKLGAVVLLNSWIAPYHHGAIASRILDHYLGAEPQDWAGDYLTVYKEELQAEEKEKQRLERLRKADAKPSLPLAKYAGRYENETYGPIVISQTANGLRWKIAKGSEADLAPWQLDSFVVRWLDPVFRETRQTYVAFHLNEEGQVIKFRTKFFRDEFEAVRVPEAATAD
jgi:CubicO group peptidase (beta-lactamase class C family)